MISQKLWSNQKILDWLSMTIDYGCNQLSYSSASDVRFTRKVCLQIKSCVLPIPFVFLRTVTIACFEWNSQLSRSALNLHILFQLNTLKITKFILKTFILLNTKTTPRHLLFPVWTVYVINHQSYTKTCISRLLS